MRFYDHQPKFYGPNLQMQRLGPATAAVMAFQDARRIGQPSSGGEEAVVLFRGNGIKEHEYEHEHEYEQEDEHENTYDDEYAYEAEDGDDDNGKKMMVTEMLNQDDEDEDEDEDEYEDKYEDEDEDEDESDDKNGDAIKRKRK